MQEQEVERLAHRSGAVALAPNNRQAGRQLPEGAVCQHLAASGGGARLGRLEFRQTPQRAVG